MTETRIQRLALICDRAGVIQKILCDDFFPAGTLLPGQSFTEWVDPGSHEKVINLLAEVNAQGSAFDWELNIAPQNRVIGLHFSGIANGDSLMIIGDHSQNDILQVHEESIRINNELANALRTAVKDQTGRKQAEEALRESEQLYRMLAENSTDVIWTMTLNGKFTYVSPSVYQLRGFTPEEVLQQPLEQAVCPDSLVMVMEGLRSTSENTQTRRQYPNAYFEIEQPCKDGTTVWTEVTARVLYSKEGQPNGLIGVSRNIAERKKAEAKLRESEAQNRAIVDSVPDLLFRLQRDGLILDYRAPNRENLYVPPEAFLNKKIADVLPPNIAKPALDALEQALTSGKMVVFEYAMDINGESRYYEDRIVPVNSEEALSVIRDITERKEAEQSLNEMRSRLHLLGDNLEEAALYVYSHDPDGRPHFEYLSAGMEKLTGLKPQDILQDASKLHSITLPEYMPKLTELEMKSKEDLTSFEMEICQRHAVSGNIRWALLRSTPRRRPDGSTVWYGVQIDITERKQNEKLLEQANEQLHVHVREVEQLQAELREQAIRDPLTGLFNRRYLNETLARELARAERENDPLSVIILDIDHFKMINDTYGHPVGDRFLVKLASLTRDRARGSDIVCRYGGEEFLLVLPGTPPDSALKRAEEIRKICADVIIEQDGKSLSVTLSLGVASYPHHGQEAEEIIINADKAMYKSKQSGRNCVTVWANEDSN